MLSLAVAMILVLLLMCDPPRYAHELAGTLKRRSAGDADFTLFGLFSFFGGVPKPTADTTWSVTGTKTEPSSGQKDAGWTVGQKPPAQWLNWWQNAVWQWLLWLSVFELQSHTWTAQQTFTAGAGITPLIGDGTAGGGNTTGLLGLASGTGSGVSGAASSTAGSIGVLGIGGAGGGGGGVLGQAGAGTADGGVVGWANSGVATGGAGVAGYGNSSLVTPGAGGDGVLGVSSTTALMTGVRGKASAVGNLAGVYGLSGFGLVPGVLGDAGNAAGAVGVKGISGGTTNFAAVWGLSTHSGVHGVYGSAGAGAAAGVYGVTGSINNPAAVYGVSSHAGVPGVKGIAASSGGTDAGIWGSGIGADGYGSVAEGKTAAPTRSAFRIVPQNADPTVPQLGDMYVNSGSKKLMLYDGTSWVVVGTQA